MLRSVMTLKRTVTWKAAEKAARLSRVSNALGGSAKCFSLLLLRETPPSSKLAWVSVSAEQTQIELS